MDKNQCKFKKDRTNSVNRSRIKFLERGPGKTFFQKSFPGTSSNESAPRSFFKEKDRGAVFIGKTAAVNPGQGEWGKELRRLPPGPAAKYL